MKYFYKCTIPFNARTFWHEIKESYEYLQFIKKEFNMKELSLLEKTRINETSMELRIKTTPKIACEAIVKKFFGVDELSAINVHKITTVEPFISEFEMIPPVKKDKISVKGTIRIISVNDNEAIQEIEIISEINMFGSSLIEKQMRSEFDKTYGRYPEVLQKYKVQYEMKKFQSEKRVIPIEIGLDTDCEEDYEEFHTSEDLSERKMDDLVVSSSKKNVPSLVKKDKGNNNDKNDNDENSNTYIYSTPNSNLCISVYKTAKTETIKCVRKTNDKTVIIISEATNNGIKTNKIVSKKEISKKRFWNCCFRSKGVRNSKKIIDDNDKLTSI